MKSRCVFEAGSEPEAGTPLKGQFCIKGPYPYGPRPSRPDNVFFLGELDAVWAVDRALADRVRADYLARGFNHLVCGPIYGQAYGGQYPDTDYLGQPERYAAFLDWWGHRFTLSAFPTHAPYYDGRGQWDLDLIRRRFLPFYQSAAIQNRVTRVMFCYEEYGRTDHMAACFELLREMFPHARRYWHNPPGHLSPAMGDEHEETAWRSSARHGIHGMYLQSHAVDEGEAEGRTALERMVYDLWDMRRRFNGDCPVPPALARFGLSPRSPWGAPVLAEDGQPLELVWAEGTAHGLYWDGSLPESIGWIWGAAARTVEGVVDCLDGA